MGMGRPKAELTLSTAEQEQLTSFARPESQVSCARFESRMNGGAGCQARCDPAGHKAALIKIRIVQRITPWHDDLVCRSGYSKRHRTDRLQAAPPPPGVPRIFAQH